MGSLDFCETPSNGEQRLAGQVAIITGGASGIGARAARIFTKQGARVVIADIQASLGEILVKELGPKALYVHCDVRKEEDVIRAWDKAYSLENKLDIVFNNAGIIGALCPLTQLPIDEFDATMGVNLRGMVLGVKHAARLMIPKGKGSIICTASVSGEIGGVCALSYSTSKGAVIAMVKAAAAELRRFGIRVNAISPNAVPTPMSMFGRAASTEVCSEKSPSDNNTEISVKKEGIAPNVTMEMIEQMVRKSTMIKGRPPSDLDIANAALYLASDMGGYVTGHNLMVDGGLSTSVPLNERSSWANGYQPMVSEGGRRGL